MKTENHARLWGKVTDEVEILEEGGWGKRAEHMGRARAGWTARVNTAVCNSSPEQGWLRAVATEGRTRLGQPCTAGPQA